MLFVDTFRRDQNAGGTNGRLNYGYTVLRATIARAVVAAGLHPGIGLHHSNDNNAMRLVDDLMEPVRPMIDLKVWQLKRNGETEVSPDTKRALVRTLYDDMQTDAGATPVMVCAQKLCTSLAQVDTFCKKAENPPSLGGKVKVLQFTDQQYERIISHHRQAKQPANKTPDQFDLF